MSWFSSMSHPLSPFIAGIWFLLVGLEVANCGGCEDRNHSGNDGNDIECDKTTYIVFVYVISLYLMCFCLLSLTFLRQSSVLSV